MIVKWNAVIEKLSVLRILIISNHVLPMYNLIRVIYDFIIKYSILFLDGKKVTFQIVDKDNFEDHNSISLESRLTISITFSINLPITRNLSKICSTIHARQIRLTLVSNPSHSFEPCV